MGIRKDQKHSKSNLYKLSDPHRRGEQIKQDRDDEFRQQTPMKTRKKH